MDDQPYFNFNIRIEDEKAVWEELGKALTTRQNLVDNTVESLRRDCTPDAVVWDAVRTNITYATVENCYLAPRIARPPEQDNLMLVPATANEGPTFRSSASAFPRSAADARTLLLDSANLDKRATIVTPVWDFEENGTRHLRGASFFGTNTGRMIVIDMALMGSDIVQLGPTLEEMETLFVFFSKDEFWAIKLTLAWRFRRIMIMDFVKVLLQTDVTAEQLASLLSTRNYVVTRLVETKGNCRSQSFTMIDMILNAQLLNIIHQRLPWLFPRTASQLLQSSLKENQLRVKDELLHRKLLNAAAGCLFQNLQGQDEFVKRCYVISRIVDANSMQWQTRMLHNITAPTNIGRTWFKRAMMQQLLSGAIKDEKSCPYVVTDADYEVLSSPEPRTGTEVHRVLNMFNLKTIMEHLKSDSPLFIQPIKASATVFEPCRGVVVFEPVKNKLIVVDFHPLSLNVIRAWKQLEDLPNLKILWDDEDSNLLRLFFGAKLSNTMLLKTLFGGPKECKKVDLPTLSVLLSTKAAMVAGSEAITAGLRNTNRDVVSAALRTKMMRVVAAASCRFGKQFLEDAVARSLESVTKAIPAWTYPTAESVLQIFKKKKFEGNSFEPGILQPSVDPHMLHRAYEWRLLQAIQLNLSEEAVLPDAAIWDAGFFRNIANTIPPRQWRAYWQRYGRSFGGPRGTHDEHKVKTAWSKMDKNMGQPMCDLCVLGRNHTKFCLVGNLVKSIRQAQAGLSSYENYYRGAAAVTEEEKEIIRTWVNIMYRLGDTFADCVDQFNGSSNKWRVDFFRSEAPGAPAVTYKILLQKFATKWIVPFTRFEKAPIGPGTPPPPGSAWVFGAEFRCCCRYHRDQLPRFVTLTDGVMAFSCVSPDQDYRPTGNPAEVPRVFRPIGPLNVVHQIQAVAADVEDNGAIAEVQNDDVQVPQDEPQNAAGPLAIAIAPAPAPQLDNPLNYEAENDVIVDDIDAQFQALAMGRFYAVNYP